MPIAVNQHFRICAKERISSCISRVVGHDFLLNQSPEYLKIRTNSVT